MIKDKIKRSIRNLILVKIARQKGKYYLPVGVSNRHLHLSKSHLNILFGGDYKLNKIKDLSQPGQYAAEETVTLRGPKGEIENIRVLGPVRQDTQVEISTTDSYKLGVKPVVRESGNIAGTPGAKLIGPCGEVKLDKGIIVAARHLHISENEAEIYGLKDGEKIAVRYPGIREIVFENVLVRVSPDYSLEIHFDTDEANAANLKNGDLVLLE